jgi:hypothetical protein
MAKLPRVLHGFKRVGFVDTLVHLRRKGPASCPDCDFCRSGAYQRLCQQMEELLGSKTEEQKAAERENEEREKLALGYREWKEMELVIV